MNNGLSSLWLLAVLLLATTTASANWEMKRAQGISGILELPELFSEDSCVRLNAEPIPLYPAPGAATPIGRVYVTRLKSAVPRGDVCIKATMPVSLLEPAGVEAQLPTLEFGYETPGAIVRKREGQWFEIALKDGHAWVHMPEGTPFYPVQDLLVGSLTYLRDKNQVRLLREPGKGTQLWQADAKTPDRLPLEVVGFRPVAGKLWLQVKLLAIKPCEDKPTGVKPVIGWLPLYGTDSLPQVWFYSRGC